MATYRMLQDHFVTPFYFPAGTIAATIDVGGILPVGWIPTPAVDPLDNDAVAAFYAVGVQLPGRITSQWTGIRVTAPVTYWQAINAEHTTWQLTGLGSHLIPVNW